MNILRLPLATMLVGLTIAAEPVDPNLVRHYVFTGQTPGVPVPDRVGGQAATYQSVPTAGNQNDGLGVAEGHVPGTRTIRLDQGCYAGPPVDPPNRAFTVMLWYRNHGQGGQRGNGDANGTLIATGNGWWDGWRLTTSHPSGRLHFDIGRPQPDHAVGIQSGSIGPGWHHATATWDGRMMRLYIDGEAAAAGSWDGVYTPPPGGTMRIGYAGSGVGSALLDLDEVRIQHRALGPSEVFCEVHAPVPTPVRESLLALEAGTAGAAAALAAQAASPGLRRDLAAAVALRAGDALLAGGDGRAAVDAYLTALGGGGSFAATAQRRLIDQVQGGTDLTPATVDRIAAIPNLAAADRLALRLGRGHALASAGDLTGARAAYAALGGDPAAPVIWRSLAWTCAGRAAILAADWSQVEAAGAALAGLADAPAHHRAEAVAWQSALVRLRSGLPARDPLASRTAAPTWPKPGAVLFVAPEGADVAPGTRERPLASLIGARDAIRRLRHGGALPAGGVLVQIGSGRYPVRETALFDARDTGEPGAPIIYRGTPGTGQPLFDAGALLTGFAPVSDPAVRARLPATVREAVRQVALRPLGIDPGRFEPGGFSSGRGFRTHPQLELFCDGEALPLARWPHKGFARIAEASGPSEGGKQPALFTYEGDHPARWAAEPEVWLHGYWCWDWADSYEKAARIDPATRTITLAPPSSTYGVRQGQRFRAVNLLCEITSPGDWCIDSANGIVYLLPSADPSRARYEVSVLETPLLALDGASHIAFEHLRFEGGRADAVRITGGSTVLLAGCTMRRFAGNAVVVHGGTSHRLVGCDISSLGRGAVVLTGGDRATLAPGGHLVENCHIHQLARIDRTYAPGVLVGGVGNRIAHNLIHDNASSAMRVEGNDHLIELNEIRDVLRESDDQGGADMWGDPTFRGNVFRHNWWHDMGNGLGCGQAGIRLDDAISGTLILGNLFQRCAEGGFGAVQIHGGKDNLVEGNLFLDCRAAISLAPWGAERWASYLTRNSAMLARVSAWGERYPELTALTQAPDTNRSVGNLAIRCPTFVLRDHDGFEAIGNRILPAGPANLSDLAAKPPWRHPALAPIPLDEIGLYLDAYRTSY